MTSLLLHTLYAVQHTTKERKMPMKKLLILISVLLALLFSAALADETVTFGTLTVPKDAAFIDLGEQVVEDWEAFYAFLEKLPQLEKVDMFS